MKLKKGQATYKLKPFHEIIRVTVYEDPVYRYVVERTSVAIPNEVSPGRPIYYVVSHDGEITFEPAPDKAYHSQIVYAPPLRVM